MRTVSQDNLFGFSKNVVGGHSARSMMYREMRVLIQALPDPATGDEIAKAILEENILDKPTLSSRKASLRHLLELYGMDSTKALFRVFWKLAHMDIDSFPQLCLICTYARDSLLRQSYKLIRPLRPGEVVSRVQMEECLEMGFPGHYSHATKKSMAQNVNTSWTFAGHLAGKATKTRCLPEPRPMSAAYAMFVGYLTGLRGERLLDSIYGALVSSNRSQLISALSLASAMGLLSLKQAAGIVEFDFSNLLTPTEQVLIYESN